MEQRNAPGDLRPTFDPSEPFDPGIAPDEPPIDDPYAHDDPITVGGEDFPGNWMIGDKVWADANRDGIQNNNESGILGVRVQLFEKGRVNPWTTWTDSDGQYSFSVAGHASQRFHLELDLSGYKATIQHAKNSTKWNDSDINSVGRTPEFGAASIEGLVFSPGGGVQPWTPTWLMTALDAGLVPDAVIESVTWVQSPKPTGGAGGQGGLLQDIRGKSPDYGIRIFAERLKYTDKVVGDEVVIQVKLANDPQGKPIQGMAIRGYVYDVDDPSSNDAIVDDEKKTTDNRDSAGVKNFSGVSDVNGVLTTTIRVSHRPGDNYRVAATLLPAGTPETVFVKQDDSKADLYFIADKKPVPLGNAKTVASEVLTVWRHLHVERDHMGAPPGEPFWGAGLGGDAPGADDVSPNGPIADPSISWMQTIYGKAYIEVQEIDTSINAHKTMSFVHNALVDN